MTTELRVDSNGPWDHRAALASLAIHAVEGLETADPDRSVHRRALLVGDEPHAVTVRLDGRGVTVAPDTEDEGVRATLAGIVRGWFDLDTGIEAVDDFFREDPVLGPHAAARPGIRVTGFTDGFEAAAMTVVGQQVSLARARQYGARLVAAYGTDGPGGHRLFPAPEAVAAETPEALQATLGTTGARARTVRAVAELFAEGFRLDPPVDTDEARRVLLAVPGIGPWTVDYLSIRAMRDPDRFPVSDAVLLRALGRPDRKETELIAARWSPWRTYAAMRLWAGQIAD